MKRTVLRNLAVLMVGAGLAAGVARAASVPAQAAAQAAATTPADHAKARLGVVASAVTDLSDAQKAEILAIYQKAYQDQVDLRAKNADAETVRDVLEKADSDAKGELTDAQKSKFPSGRALRAAGI